MLESVVQSFIESLLFSKIIYYLFLLLLFSKATYKVNIFFPDPPVPGNETPDYKLFSFQGFNLISGIHLPDEVEQIKSWEIRDSDVFLLSYPKSGLCLSTDAAVLVSATC